jgi:dipeptidyl aminopeptidase/acylaminoacyl peptidase
VLTSDSVDPEIEERWQARFRAARMTLPQWARLQPERCLFVSNASGTFELYRWDRSTDSTAQVTDRPAGTHIGAIDPSGEWIWWFDDADGNEFGIWRREPFSPAPAAGSEAGSAAGSKAAEIAAPGLAASYPSGLCLGENGLAIIGRSTDDGASIYVVRPGHEPALLYAHQQDASVVALSRDGSLVALEHSEHGDSRHTALRVLQLDGGASVGDLWDGPGLGVEAVAFAPVAGDTRLIARHERLGRWVPFIWDVASGEQHALGLELDLPGDVSATWYADASGLLVAHEYQARSSLYRYDLAAGALEQLEIPAGTVSGATARPDGVVEFLWSSSAEPSAVRDSSGRIVVQPPGELAPSSVAVEDAWVDGPGGPIHALISKPAGMEGPMPTVFHVHGGPTSHDADAFSPAVAAWVDVGFAVVRVNYRGSTGYGSAWRDAIEHRVGLTELEDISAVRDWTVASGLADPTRIVLAGASWGGYLTLLGLGMSPDAWSVGVAGVPVADYVAAYEDEMEGLRAMDRALFGGTPDEVPDRYHQSSPLTYVDAVVAPVLVLAGANDPRCPIRQIDNYLGRLAARAVPFEVYRFDAGHGSLVVEERISQMAAQLNYARRHLATSQRVV